MGFTVSNRMVVPASRSAVDPGLRVIGHITSNIDLADDAEYNLGASPQLGGVPPSGAVFEVRHVSRERAIVARARVMAKADVAFSASAHSTNVLTLTVSAGASEGIQAGQWLKIHLTTPSLDANALLDENWVLVTATTSTTIVAAFIATDEAAMGAGVAESMVVYAESGPPEVLWDSIIAADNQSEILGTLRPGKYVVNFLDTLAKAGIIFSDGTVMNEYMEDNSTDEENTSVAAATSDTVTSLFVSSGNVVLRNGADIAAKIRVTFYPNDLTGLDQDGAMCLYVKGSSRYAAPSLRLRNRKGATVNDIELARVA